MARALSIGKDPEVVVIAPSASVHAGAYVQLDTYKEGHGIMSSHEYRDFQERAIVAVRLHRQRMGMSYENLRVHAVFGYLRARVDCNRWIVDCVCGSGCFVDVELGLARCCGCGAVYMNVVLPAARQQIEEALVARPDPGTRFWHPNETVADLLAENAKHLAP